MDTKTIIEIISNVGFPIAMCIALFYYMWMQRKQHGEEMEHLRETVEENTLVLTELSTLIKVLSNEKNR